MELNAKQEYKINYIQTLLKETGNKCGIQLYMRDIYVFSMKITYYDGKTYVSRIYSIKEFDELNPHIIVNEILEEFERENIKKEGISRGYEGFSQLLYDTNLKIMSRSLERFKEKVELTDEEIELLVLYNEFCSKFE